MGAQAVRLSNVDIDRALENADFEVRFQPIFDLGNGALARMETFVRWRHPTLGVLPPGAFISFFETQGRMSELTRFVLDATLKAYTEWRGPFAPGFSLNLALSDLSDEAFSSHFTKLLRDYEFPADLVTLECPMPPVDTDIDVAAAQFARLAATGARLAIEVRGRANDLLRNIDPFPFDEIKTGGSSILRFARTVRGPGLSAISDLLEIANNANAVITAVGVEDQASLAALRGLGFTAAQGNHLGKVGNITDFMPSHVNDIRQLLGLEALSAESLAALFRTNAPGPTVNELDAFTVEDQVNPEALIERLSNRLKQQQEEADHAERSVDVSADLSAQATKTNAKSTKGEEQRKSKAREKAKILAVAKREKAREIRKAAAIARAKSKTNASDESDLPIASGQAPRELQQRLSDEYLTGASGNIVAAAPSEAPPPVTDGDAPQVAPESAPSNNQQAKKLSVPEKLAAAAQAVDALSTRSPVASPSERPPSPQDGNPTTAIQMPVGEVTAYFQPGIRVGGPAYNQEVRSPSIDAANAHNKASQAAPPQYQAANNPLADPVAPNEPIDIVPDQKDTPNIAAPSEEICVDTPTETDIEGDLFDTPLDGDALRAKLSRKNFLARTVFPYPTHFWPKSWVRRYQRLTVKHPANDAPEETIQAAE